MLAALDDAAADDQTALTASAGQPTQSAAQAQAAGDTDGEDDADAAPELTAALPSLNAPGAVQTKLADATSDKTDSKSDDAKPAANDNDGTQQPLPALPVPTAPQLQVQASAQTQSQDQSIAPLANAAAPSQAAAAKQADDADQNDGASEPAAAPQGAAATDKAAPAAAKKSDFKKMLDDAKTAAAKSADATPARDADAGKTDAQQADTALPQASAAHSGNQTNSPTNMQSGALAVNAPAAANAVQNTNVTAQTLHTAAPHQAANMQGLAVEIAARSQSGAKQFDIRLDPPELGRVQVRLSIDATGKAEAHLTADQPQTLDLLQKDAPALTRALREAGLDVSQDGLNFSLRQQQQQAGQDQPQFQSHRTLRAGFTGANNNETASAGAAYSSRGQGLLDIRV